MSRRIAAKITGVSGYVPPRVMSNAELEKLVDTNDAWIRERTGIRERHVADPGVATSDLATAAAKILLESRGVPADDIDLIVVASVTPDMMFPATACLVQDKLAPRTRGGSIFRPRAQVLFMPSQLARNSLARELRKRCWSSEAM